MFNTLFSALENTRYSISKAFNKLKSGSMSQEEIENIRLLKEEGDDACNDHFWELRQKYFEKELKKRGHLVELDQWSSEFNNPYTLLLNIPS